MRFLENHEYGAGAPDSLPAFFATQSHLEDQIENNADGCIGSGRGNPAEIKNGHWLVPPEPLVHDLNERIRTCRISAGLLKEPQLGIK